MNDISNLKFVLFFCNTKGDMHQQRQLKCNVLVVYLIKTIICIFSTLSLIGVIFFRTGVDVATSLMIFMLLKHIQSSCIGNLQELDFSKKVDMVLTYTRNSLQSSEVTKKYMHVERYHELIHTSMTYKEMIISS